MTKLLYPMHLKIRSIINYLTSKTSLRSPEDELTLYGVLMQIKLLGHRPYVCIYVHYPAKA